MHEFITAHTKKSRDKSVRSDRGKETFSHIKSGWTKRTGVGGEGVPRNFDDSSS